MSTPATNGSWWGPTRIAIGEQRKWRIGPLQLRVAHLGEEWRIRHSSGGDPLEATVRLAEPECVDTPLEEDEETLRFAQSGEAAEIVLQPILADRPIVSHPTEPFFVLPRDDVRLFVSTPLWLRLGIGEGRDLCELPIVRPSDTWVGSTTGNGEASYSSRTSCRLRLEDLPVRPHRARTVVDVHNHSAEALRLERITLAVPHLSLYASREGRLWTESVSLTRAADDPDVDFRIDTGPPTQVGAGDALSSPRKPLDGRGLRRAFDALF